MTAEELHYEELAEVEAPPPAAVLPESPFSLTWRMVDASGCDVQVTMRAGVTDKAMINVMRARKTFLEGAQQAGWQFTATSKPAPAAAPSNGHAAPAAPASPAPGQWVPPPPTGPVAANVAGGSFASKPRESFVAVKMEVTPRPDGKADVKLYAAGHQWADITVTRSPEQLATAFAKVGAWTADHFRQIESYEPVSYLVEYTLSDKKNSKGNPYKDLADIRPA